MMYPSLTVATMLLSFNITIIMIILLNAVLWLRHEPIISAMLSTLAFGCFTVMFRVGISVDYF